MIKKILKIAGICLLFLFLTAGLIFLVSSIWLIKTWGGLTFEEVVFHLNAPMEGANSDIAKNYLVKYALPAVICCLLLVVPYVLLRKKKIPIRIFTIALPCLAVILFVSGALYLNSKLDIITYFKNQKSSTDFIENNYAKPGFTKMTFPEEKRNLIYIYLESMETTYADKASGGAFDENVIPELTKISMNNENFSGDTKVLNGGVSLSGSTWTIGAIFAQTAGIPLKAGITHNDMSTQEEFFPSLITLGDILESEGYNNEFMAGSDFKFGGRDIYFKEHGNYKIFDYYTAIDEGLIDEDYKVWWGFEDEKLFSYAKSEILDLADESEPFNFTMLTVDTHFEDGYVCDLCPEIYEDDQYSNVMRCSSKQVDDFLKWCEKQDFYDNTTIILCGDHPTMDANYCSYISYSYQRKVYTTIINAPVEPEDPSRYRNYSTMDMFPTTLAALGVEISGNRLGLGTNLFSSEDTLIEKYGISTLNAELAKRSAFLESMNTAEVNEDLIEKYKKDIKFSYSLETPQYGIQTFHVSYKTKSILKEIYGFESLTMDLYYDDDVISMPFEVDLKSKLSVKLKNFMPDKPIRVVITITIDGESYVLHDDTIDNPLIKSASLDEYLMALQRETGKVIIIAAKDEMSSGLSENTCELLKELGITSDLKSGYRNGFIAVITDDGVIFEEMGKGYDLTYEGKVGNTSYSVISSGYEDNRIASVIIDDDEKCRNRRGLNFVILDGKTGEVISSDSFDTYEGDCPRVF